MNTIKRRRKPVKLVKTGQKGSAWVSMGQNWRPKRSKRVKVVGNRFKKRVKAGQIVSNSVITGENILKRVKTDPWGFESTIPRGTEKPLRKNFMQWHNNNTQHSMGIATYRLNRPGGRFSKNKPNAQAAGSDPSQSNSTHSAKSL